MNEKYKRERYMNEQLFLQTACWGLKNEPLLRYFSSFFSASFTRTVFEKRFYWLLPISYGTGQTLEITNLTENTKHAESHEQTLFGLPLSFL